VGRPPVNLILIAEGEEELGSPSLPAYVKKEKKRLSRASALYFPFFSQDTDGSITLLLGNKGCVYFELECSGKAWGRGPQEFAIHSANKAWVDSPVWRLVQALGTMATDNGNKVLIDGFYDDIDPPTKDDEKLIEDAAERLSLEAAKDEIKVSEFMFPDRMKVELLKSLNFTSTLNIDGIWAGWIEKGSKTVLPHEATCKIDIRLVPRQDKEKMLGLVRQHLDEHGYKDIKITEIDNYIDWSKCDVKEHVVQSMIRSLKEYNCDPCLWPLDPSSVPYYIFTMTLNIPFTNGGMGHSALSHSPNEYIVIKGNDKIAGFADAEKFMVHFMNEFGQRE
jgi:acetylornithine deacetylase/succinyl-diaminopimelate desuccinylase-like protein